MIIYMLNVLFSCSFDGNIQAPDCADEHFYNFAAP